MKLRVQGLAVRNGRKTKIKKSQQGDFVFLSITYKHGALLISKTHTNPLSLSLENIYHQAYLSVESKRKDKLEGANANI